MIKPIHLIPEDTKLNFLSFKNVFLGLSILFVLISFLSTWIIGLNFGIDFRGGVLLELRSKMALQIFLNSDLVLINLA